MTKASSASVSVVARCGQMKPLDSQSHSRSAMSLGRLKKNGSRILVAERICQVPMRATKVRTCRAMIRGRPALRRMLDVASVSSSGDAASGLSRIVLPFHLVAQIGPDPRIEAHEAGAEADLRNVARTREVDIVDALEPRRTGGEPDDPVGERDRLLEIM